MILLDLSPVIYSTFLATHKDGMEIDEGYIRHLILNCIRSYIVKFKSDYGELVICADTSSNWRKGVFPEYKAARKKGRDDSGLDWKKLFEIIEKVKSELKSTFPYKFLEIENAEADDIIAVLAKHHANLSSEKILIISGDKDFKQLQKYDNVSQYNTVKKEWIKCEDPLLFIKEHILLGDKSDGIPNFLSDDDVFVTDKRQTPIHKKKLAIWVTQEPKHFCNSRMQRNFDRNKMLIDFDYIPEDIAEAVLKEFEVPPKTRAGLYNYFVKNKLINLIGSIGDF